MYIFIASVQTLKNGRSKPTFFHVKWRMSQGQSGKDVQSAILKPDLPVCQQRQMLPRTRTTGRSSMLVSFKCVFLCTNVDTTYGFQK